MEAAPELRPVHPEWSASDASVAVLPEVRKTQVAAQQVQHPKTAVAAPELPPDPAAEAAQK